MFLAPLKGRGVEGELRSLLRPSRLHLQGTASALHPAEAWPGCVIEPLQPPCSMVPHLHESVEQRVRVLLFPSVSHGLLHSQAVLDIRLEPLAKLEEQILGRQKRVMNRLWL